jgi:hypothetical protein
MSGKPTPAADRAEILRTLILLGPRDAVRELRILKTKRDGTVSGYFDDPELLATEAEKWSGKAPAIYVTLNELPRSALARCANRVETRAAETTTDADMARRRFLGVDTDPTRLSRISATDEEHGRSIARVREIAEWAQEVLGLPAPVIADSGNGGHALWPIDLPNDADSLALVESCLRALAALFDGDGITVDQKVGNAARIWKLYGTAACKGDSVPERPHRLARLLEVPERLEAVTVEQIRALAAFAPAPEAKSAAAAQTAPGSTASGPATRFDVPGWLTAHGIAFRDPKPWQGGLLWPLDPCPFNPDHAAGEARVIQLPSGAVSARCFHNSCTWD